MSQQPSTPYKPIQLKPSGKIEPRQTVQAIKAYTPPLEGRRERIRLDFNENTAGFPEAYPSEPSTLYIAYPEYDAFLEQLSTAWNIPQERLLITNGSDEALFLAAFTFIEPGRDTALTVSPTFSLIPHYLKLVNSYLIETPYTDDFQYDIPAIEQQLCQEDVKLAIFASPDNPTGATLPIDVIRRWCESYPNTLFVIDEAYAEYTEATALPLINRVNNLLITRTFSKAWGMAGLRLGVMLGAPYLMEALKRVRSPYSVNTLAIQTAAKLLSRQAEVRQEAHATMERKAYLLEEVKKRGYQVIPGQANFFLIRVGLDAEGFCEFFRKRGILLRNQSSRPRLQGMVRVSIGTQTEIDRFLTVLDELPQKRVLLFDMDGTLVDTRQSFDATIAQLVEKHSGQSLKEGELDALRSEGGFNDDWEATVEILRRRGVNITYDAILDEAQNLYLTLAPETETWLSSPEHLAQLQKRYRLGVATGRCRMEFDPIWKARFAPLFETVVCQDDNPECAKKPSPELLHSALENLNAEEGIYVGNSVDDMRAAKAAGLMAIGVTLTHDIQTLQQAGADFVFESLDDIIDAFLGTPTKGVPST